MIQFDIGGRQTGKTTRLLDWLEKQTDGEHRVLVSHSRQRAMDLLRQARQEERVVESWQFVSVDEVLRGTSSHQGVLLRGGDIVLGVDDLDLTLSTFFSFPVTRVTASAEDETAEI